MVIFVAGLMKDSRPLVQYVYEMQVEDYVNKMRTDRVDPSIDADLFESLQAESSVRLVDDPSTINTSTTTTTGGMPPTQPRSTVPVDCMCLSS